MTKHLGFCDLARWKHSVGHPTCHFIFPFSLRLILLSLLLGEFHVNNLKLDFVVNFIWSGNICLVHLFYLHLLQSCLELIFSTILLSWPKSSYKILQKYLNELFSQPSILWFSDSFPLPFFLASNKLKSKHVWHTHLFLLLVWKINTFRLFYLVIIFKKLAGVIDLMESKCSVPQSMDYRLVPIQELCCTVRFSSRWDYCKVEFPQHTRTESGALASYDKGCGNSSLGTQMSMSEAAAAASGSGSFLAFSHWEFPLLPCLFRYVVKKMWIILPARWGCYSVRIFSLGFHVRNGSLSQGTFIIRKNINMFKRNKGTHLYRGLVFPSPRWKSSLSGPNPVVLVPQPVYPSPD